ncbi:MAG: bifunctional nuclease family protein [Sphingobacteriaceae bacterium]|nr:bifunctional nuclease family protein [Sphingobacteriaceae bacterium]
MKKVQLEIVGLSYSQTQSGAYALVLGESAGSRRLPIIIGGFEAQAIAIELEKMSPSRPLTHDLFRSFAEVFDINVTEVLIYNLVEGIFYAKLLCNDGSRDVEIDARTSDAIALAIRFKCPIYTYEFILKSAGLCWMTKALLHPEQEAEAKAETKPKSKEVATSGEKGEYKSKSTEELKGLLQNALDEEKYELASKIRDELNNRKKS